MLPLDVTSPTSPQLNLEQLLKMGVAAARAGNRAAAHSLFLALTRAYPDEVRAWLGLAGVAVSVQEQYEALAHVVALDPEHAQARQALAKLTPPPSADVVPLLSSEPVASSNAPAAPDIAEEPELQSAVIAIPDAARGRFPLLNMIAMAIIAVLLIVLIIMGIRMLTGASQRADTPAPIPSSVLQMAATASPLPATAVISLPAFVGTAGPTALVRSTAISATPPAEASPSASLPLGTLVEVDGWSTTLLRPDYALVLDGSIGDLQPSGRFVLALMAVSNNSSAQRHIPADLFTLVDSRGRHYAPVPNASSAYLALYGRGQHGDLAFEDALAPSSGMRSVPILFDVPQDATGLLITIRNSGTAGWLIESVNIPAINTGP
ncbi:MAG: hypothetical protein HGA19_04760 [Oscillochloris sp.]|nr:hypothetical protein [Oscillochloris sp.]